MSIGADPPHSRSAHRSGLPYRESHCSLNYISFAVLSLAYRSGGTEQRIAHRYRWGECVPLLGLSTTSIGRFNFVLLTSELYRTSEGLLICSSHSFLELSREHYRHMFSIAIARHKTQSVETKAAPTSRIACCKLFDTQSTRRL